MWAAMVDGMCGQTGPEGGFNIVVLHVRNVNVGILTNVSNYDSVTRLLEAQITAVTSEL